VVVKGECLTFLRVIYSDIWFKLDFGNQSIVYEER
jgi:hypothetical protein